MNCQRTYKKILDLYLGNILSKIFLLLDLTAIYTLSLCHSGLTPIVCFTLSDFFIEENKRFFGSEIKVGLIPIPIRSEQIVPSHSQS